MCESSQPEPYLATRRIVGFDSPPIQIGGCGRWSGFGSKSTSSKLCQRPLKLGVGSVQSFWISSIDSSV